MNHDVEMDWKAKFIDHWPSVARANQARIQMPMPDYNMPDDKSNYG